MNEIDKFHRTFVFSKKNYKSFQKKKSRRFNLFLLRKLILIVTSETKSKGDTLTLNTRTIQNIANVFFAIVVEAKKSYVFR